MTESERRHFEVLLEEINHSVKTIAEGHVGLVEGMDRLDAKLDRRANELDEKIGWVAESVQAASKASEERDAVLEARLTARIEDVRKDLRRDIMRVGEKVEGHEERISALERKAA